MPHNNSSAYARSVLKRKLPSFDIALPGHRTRSFLPVGCFVGFPYGKTSGLCVTVAAMNRIGVTIPSPTNIPEESYAQ